MSEEALSLQVECYAGHRGEQAPRVLVIGDRRVAVTVLDQWLAPDHRYFKLEADDGYIYIVRHDVVSDAWELTLAERDGRDQRCPAKERVKNPRDR
jgi:hypothetical protein